MSSATDRPLHPWERRTLRCDRCGRLATQRISASTWADDDEAAAVTAEPGEIVITIAARDSALTCDEHYEQTQDALLDVHGGTSNEVLRDTWQRWLWRHIWPLTLIAEMKRLLNNYVCYRDRLVVSAALHGTPYPDYLVWREFLASERDLKQRLRTGDGVAKFRYVDTTGAPIDMDTPA